jgi:hypothetical protein
MADQRAAQELPDFDSQYRPLLKQVFAEIARKEQRGGAEPDEKARLYAERGKPDFVLAFLLAGALSQAQKREIFAYAHEQRAAYIERRAREFDQQFHRPFPLLHTEAAKDRTLARQIRAGRPISKGAGRQLPTL